MNATGQEEGGHIAANIMHFARVLRAAGLPIGPGQVIDAVQAVKSTGLGRRDDFYWTMQNTLKLVKPNKIIFATTDLWYNFFWSSVFNIFS